jgi:hypothetical protein
MVQQTAAPDAVRMSAGAGTAAAQSAAPRLYADVVNGGWDVMATGATAGAPGTFTPAGSKVPANLAAMTGVTATPATAWTVGQRVVLADTSEAYWNATAWAAGRASVVARGEGKNGKAEAE